MNDILDSNFIEGLKKLANIDDDTVNELIEKADIDQLTELSNAVATNDQRRALSIYYSLKNQKVPESVNRLNVGDLVYVGKKKYRVQIPNGPSDTVGLLIGKRKKVKMVDRRKISLSEEMGGSVLGMTMLPAIARMQELAGLSPEPENAVTTEVLDDDEIEYDDHMATAMNAISALRDALPEIALKDAKIIRKSLNDLLISMNESAPPKGRKLKE